MSEEVFSIAEKHPPRDFLTISTNSGIQSENNITYFSLGKNTDISEETYPNNVVLIGNHGLLFSSLEIPFTGFLQKSALFILKFF